MTGWQDWINKGVNSFFDFYRSPSQNEFDYNVKQFARNLPVIGSMFQADDNSRRMNDYLSNRGLSWSDIRYNQAPFGATYGSSLAKTIPSVSAMSLYRSATRSSVKKKSIPRGKRQHALAAASRTANGSRRVYQNRMFLR